MLPSRSVSGKLIFVFNSVQRINPLYLGDNAKVESGYMVNIKAVLFDWDFTMGATCGDVSVPERLATLLNHLGFSYDVDTIGEAVAQHKEQYLHSRGGTSPRLQTRDEWLRYYVELLGLLGHNDANGDSEEIAAQMFDEYAQLPFALYPDVHPALNELSERGYPLGVISNHSTNIRPKMIEVDRKSTRLNSSH